MHHAPDDHARQFLVRSIHVLSFSTCPVQFNGITCWSVLHLGAWWRIGGWMLWGGNARFDHDLGQLGQRQVGVMEGAFLWRAVGCADGCLASTLIILNGAPAEHSLSGAGERSEAWHVLQQQARALHAHACVVQIGARSVTTPGMRVCQSLICWFSQLAVHCT